MLIYEKENKLNISFDNEIKENPDLQIGKEDGKTEVLIDGQPSGGSGGGVLIVHDNDGTLDKTMGEIQEAFLRNDRIELQGNSGGRVTHSKVVHMSEVHFDGRAHTYDAIVSFAAALTIVSYGVSASSEDSALAGYPTRSN